LRCVPLIYRSSWARSAFEKRFGWHPPFFAAHVLEEWPCFTRWVNRYASKKFTQADFARNNASGMATAILGCVALSIYSNRAVVFLFFVSVVAQLFFNMFFHLWTTVAFRTYSPGLWTSLLLYPPLSIFLALLAYHNGLIGAKSGSAMFFTGAALHAFFVNRQVFHARFL
jgi:hypothetical protein